MKGWLAGRRIELEIGDVNDEVRFVLLLALVLVVTGVRRRDDPVVSLVSGVPSPASRLALRFWPDADGLRKLVDGGEKRLSGERMSSISWLARRLCGARWCSDWSRAHSSSSQSSRDDCPLDIGLFGSNELTVRTPDGGVAPTARGSTAGLDAFDVARFL